MYSISSCELAQARVADLHRQAQRDALARAARQASRARGEQAYQPGITFSAFRQSGAACSRSWAPAAPDITRAPAQTPTDLSAVGAAVRGHRPAAGDTPSASCRNPARPRRRQLTITADDSTT